MNQVVLMGRLTRDPDIRYSQGENAMAIASFILAVDRRSKDKSADFITCKAFGKTAEFIEKYARKGIKFVLTGSIQTGSYENKEGRKVYTTDVVVREMEFAESKNESKDDRIQESHSMGQTVKVIESEFVNVPEGIDTELPFA